VVKIADLLGNKGIQNDNHTNKIGEFLPELTKDAPRDFPKNFRVFIHQFGAIMGEEDALSEETMPSKFSGTVKCIS